MPMTSPAAHLSIAARNRGEIDALARANALATVAGHRRHALWITLALYTEASPAAPIAVGASARAARVDLIAPTEGQDTVAGYAHTALTLRPHPLALLRDRFSVMVGLKTAAQVNTARHCQPIRTAGVVTCRQRPSIASGVTFVSLEDEISTINVVVCRATAEQYRRELLGAMLLTVFGHGERVETAAHASAASDRSATYGSAAAAQRFDGGGPRFSLNGPTLPGTRIHCSLSQTRPPDSDGDPTQKNKPANAGGFERKCGAGFTAACGAE